MAVIRHLELFWRILTVDRVKKANVRHAHHAKFRGDRSNGRWDMMVFRYFKMAAVRHLGFVMRVFGPPTNGIWWFLSLCKLWFKLIDAVVSIMCTFCELDWKRPIYAPKAPILGAWVGVFQPNSQNLHIIETTASINWTRYSAVISTKPQRHILARSRVVWAIDRSDL